MDVSPVMVAAPFLLLLLQAAPTDSAGVAVRVVRFFRPETGQTQVASFIKSPPVPGGSLTLRVTEADGTPLWEQSWNRPVSGSVEDAIDHLRFTVGAGQYAVEVEVRDSAGREAGRVRVPVPGYDGNPGVSDLLIAPRIRMVQHADTIPEPAEFRRGSLLITAPGRVRIDAAQPVLHYLLEAYTPYGGQGVLVAEVRDGDGRVVREAAPAPVRIPADLGVLTGQLGLEGLATGRYLLVTSLTIGERRFGREAWFEIRAPAGAP